MERRYTSEFVRIKLAENAQLIKDLRTKFVTVYDVLGKQKSQMFTIAPCDLQLPVTLVDKSIEEKLKILYVLFIKQSPKMLMDDDYNKNVNHWVDFANLKLTLFHDENVCAQLFSYVDLSAFNFSKVLNAINNKTPNNNLTLVGVDLRLYSLYQYYFVDKTQYIYSSAIWNSVVRISRCCEFTMPYSESDFPNISYYDYCDTVRQFELNLRTCIGITENGVCGKPVIDPQIVLHILFLLSNASTFDLFVNGICWKEFVKEEYISRGIYEVSSEIFEMDRLIAQSPYNIYPDLNK